MRGLAQTVLTGVLLAVVAGGCVERKMLIRSDPPGTPVWVDERPVLLSELSEEDVPFGTSPEPGSESVRATTPLEYPFEHYGVRRVRVGAVRDGEGKALFVATEREVVIEPPWYQWFPIDFFVEVVWPFTVVDTHEIMIELEPAEPPPPTAVVERALEVSKEAERFREKALQPVT